MGPSLGPLNQNEDERTLHRCNNKPCLFFSSSRGAMDIHDASSRKIFRSGDSSAVIGRLRSRARGSLCLHYQRVRFGRRLLWASCVLLFALVDYEERLGDDLIFKLNRPEAQPIWFALSRWRLTRWSERRCLSVSRIIFPIFVNRVCSSCLSDYFTGFVV